MCFLRCSFFRIRYLYDKCCRRCQNSSGERTRLRLRLLLSQSFKEGVMLGMPSEMPDFDTVFPHDELLHGQLCHHLNLVDSYQIL